MVRNKHTDPNQQQQKGASPPQGQVPPSASASGPVRQPTTENVDQRKAEQQRYWQHVLSPEILPNWLLFIVGAIGVLFAWRTLKDLETQSYAIQMSAEAAKKSAEIAEQALQISQRADILLTHAVLRRGEVFDCKNWRLELRFKNFGLTRAKNVRLSVGVLIEGVTVPPTQLPPITMGAGGEQPLTFLRFDKYISQNMASNILLAELPLRFEGTALYEDVFGKQHTTMSSGTLLPHTGDFIMDKQEGD